MPTIRIARPATSLLSAAARRSSPTVTSQSAICQTARRAYTATALPSRTARARPRLHAATTTSNLFPSTSRGATRSIFIQTESTPNVDALKFRPNHRVLPEEVATPFVEYLNPRSTIAPPYPSPLAASLMNIDGVTAVFYGADFITVTKDTDANWAHIKPEIFSLITEAITAGQPLVVIKQGDGVGADGGGQGQEGVEADSLAYNENDSETVGMIKELLETRIRPAIQEDGGDIEFRGFEDGYVMLKLRGACRTCDSSTVTLKNGIEGMLMHYVSCSRHHHAHLSGIWRRVALTL